ncbi:Phosphoadenosine phosphosulfate reductase family protein [Lachnospiraceae bacterium G11]|nr:Phosphoadenosine phosphosulfate reductase family protein [Lachnospiraceae bacterium G11]
MSKLDDLIDEAPNDEIIKKSLTTTFQKLKDYDKIICSISGGSDSDLIIDLCQQFDESNKIQYVFFDTGLEFEATKEHIRDLERRYNVEIKRIRAVKPIPVCCREYGQPFLSKQVSEWISRLQRHGFQWDDTDDLEFLMGKYHNCKAALRWWCNDYPKALGGKVSSYNIEYNSYLKEFMIENPPQFSISNKCCHFAKKKVASDFKKKEKPDLNMYGVRKAEGGARKGAYKNCFTTKKSGADEYRPVFWYLESTKKTYEEHYGVEHSRCYTEYGLKRTGCAGCPYARNNEEELRAMEMYEPRLYRAVSNVFRDSYEYTRAYREYVARRKGNDQNG